MNAEQYHDLKDVSEIDRVIMAKDLIDKTNRTLLYGYTCERDTWHIYLKDCQIISVIYKYRKQPERMDINSNYHYVPDKRLYPECCDYEFCKLLKEKGISLPFTTWTDRSEKLIYYGEVL